MQYPAIDHGAELDAKVGVGLLHVRRPLCNKSLRLDVLAIHASVPSIVKLDHPKLVAHTQLLLEHRLVRCGDGPSHG